MLILSGEISATLGQYLMKKSDITVTQLAKHLQKENQVKGLEEIKAIKGIIVWCD